MSVRTRFAPSPTGHLHIGGARTALFCYLLAKVRGGQYILRIEDTDQERSKAEFEKEQISDLKWLGLLADESPENPGEFGPYRQSERLEIYKKQAEQLLAEGKAYYCFCTEEELETKKEQAKLEGRDPHYDGTHRDYPIEDARARIEKGEKAVVRLIAPRKPYQITDLVRGDVTFPENMVGDFIIMRSDGFPVYNFCCVVDDALMNISHVIRGEDHMNNTLRQLMIYEALKFDLPEFAHVSLLVGDDRQKLSKRHGATSVKQYREEGFLPEALTNYLCLLGWSHPEEKDVFKLNDIFSLFDTNRFSKAAAMFDKDKLLFINGQHLKTLGEKDWNDLLGATLKDEKQFSNLSQDWKNKFIELIKDKIHTTPEMGEVFRSLFTEDPGKDEETDEVSAWETTGQIGEYLLGEVKSSNDPYITSESFQLWQGHLKKELKIKGKPLFKGLRVALTGHGHGPDLKVLVTLVPREVLLKRLESKYGG